MFSQVSQQKIKNRNVIVMHKLLKCPFPHFQNVKFLVDLLPAATHQTFQITVQICQSFCWCYDPPPYPYPHIHFQHQLLSHWATFLPFPEQIKPCWSSCFLAATSTTTKILFLLLCRFCMTIA